MMRMAEWDAELEPKLVPDGSVLYQEVLLILQNHGEAAEMIADLRPENHGAPPICRSKVRMSYLGKVEMSY